MSENRGLGRFSDRFFGLEVQDLVEGYLFVIIQYCLVVSNHVCFLQNEKMPKIAIFVHLCLKIGGWAGFRAGFFGLEARNLVQRYIFGIFRIV